jgi:hypothetical protein
MVLFSFSQKFCTLCKIFVKRIGSSTLPEAISPVKTRDRLLHASIGRFAVFTHFVVFVVQTSTA